jgi:hypothetical protein
MFVRLVIHCAMNADYLISVCISGKEEINRKYRNKNKYEAILRTEN